jgi:hypothetical protein
MQQMSVFRPELNVGKESGSAGFFGPRSFCSARAVGRLEASFFTDD